MLRLIAAARPVIAAGRPVIAAGRPVIAAVSLVTAAVPLVAPAPAHATSWVRPVDGVVTRPFAMHGSPFAAGRHRGADLAAPPGTPVRAPCGGRVAVAGRIGDSGGVVTIACGAWRASVLPLRRITVRAGQAVAAGAAVGESGASPAHAGIHFGVRRASDRFGYVDPLRLLRRAGHPPMVPAGPRPRWRARPRLPAPGPRPPSPVRPRRPVRPRPPVRLRPRVVPPGDRRGLPAPAPLAGVIAPWPAWAGLALLAAASGGALHRRHVRRARRREAVGLEPRAVRG